MHYIIQENTFRETNYDNLVKALDRLELKYTTVRVFPFINKVTDIEDIKKLESGAYKMGIITDPGYDVDELPDFIPPQTDVFVFGSLKLARIARKWESFPGSLMNDNHDFLVYSRHYKENLLNYDSEIHYLTQNLFWTPGEVKFIRPTKDTKAFTGALFTEEKWNLTVEYYLHTDNAKLIDEKHHRPVSEVTHIQVSTPKNIHREIRCWVVDGKIVSASQYKLGSRVISQEVYDEPELFVFAQSMVDLFQLADAFVIDVCQTDSGWKIVECGCINCAGFYEADMQKVIMALEDHFLRVRIGTIRMQMDLKRMNQADEFKG